MISLDPSSLNRRIVIEQQATEQDESGQQVNAWSPVHSCWAQIRAATSKEVYAAAGFVSQLSHVVVIRYTAAPITSSMRVAYKQRTFDVQAVADPDEGRVALTLYCLERNT